MHIAIANVLSPEETSAVRDALERARFIEGQATAGFAARTVKNNRQAAGDDRSLETIRKLVAERILGNELFCLAARPKALSPLLLSRYEPGMEYGSHVDDALMGGMRSDVSFTLFLSDAASYDGGELIIESAGGEEAFRLDAGSLIAYPATSLHRVGAVTRGARLAAVGWARSFVRDPAQRELLFDLDTARRQLFAREGKSTEFDLISKSFANLLRMWADDCAAFVSLQQRETSEPQIHTSRGWTQSEENALAENRPRVLEEAGTTASGPDRPQARIQRHTAGRSVPGRYAPCPPPNSSELGDWGRQVEYPMLCYHWMLRALDWRRVAGICPQQANSPRSNGRI